MHLGELESSLFVMEKLTANQIIKELKYKYLQFRKQNTPAQHF